MHHTSKRLILRAGLGTALALAAASPACSTGTSGGRGDPSRDGGTDASAGSGGSVGSTGGAGASGASSGGAAGSGGGIGSGAAATAGGATGAGGAASAGGGTSSGGSATGDAGSGGAASSGGATGTGGGGVPDAAPPPPCDATCHFVRESATGTGDGTDWNDAFTELPAVLERGHTYYLSDGNYPSYRFDDAATGSDVITVRKATEAVHGTDIGWLDDMGDGRARFGTFDVRADYVTIDGVLPGGILAQGDFEGSVVSIGGDHVILRNAEIDGRFSMNGGSTHAAGACTGLDVGGNSYVTIDGVHVHDAADDGVSLGDTSYLTFTGNTVHALHACGSDTGCGPCYNGHSDGIEAYHVEHAEFSRNFVYDVRSTSTFFFGNWADTLGNGPADYCKDVLIQNNVFYAPEVGLVAYIQDAAGVDVFHNVFWGVRQGGYGGLSVGPHVTALRLYDNVILSINMNHTGATFDAAEHHGDYNLFGVSLGQWTDGPHDVVSGDPGFVGIPDLNGAAVTTPTALDFMLTGTSACLGKGWAGDATTPIPTTDFVGAARSIPPDIGAFERP